MVRIVDIKLLIAAQLSSAAFFLLRRRNKQINKQSVSKLTVYMKINKHNTITIYVLKEEHTWMKLSEAVGAGLQPAPTQTRTKYLFSIPDSLAVRILNRALLAALTEYPEWFYDDFEIETAYGCPGHCPWTGNRYIGTEDFDEGWADEVVGFYEKAGIKYRLVFTNFLLRKPDLQNEIGNKVSLQLSRRGGCSVMVSTPMMYQYMTRYHGLKRCWSTTTDFGKTADEQIEKINRLSERDLVVIPYEFNNKPELERFTHPENLEVLLNEDCVDNCPKRREHWANVCRAALEDGHSHSTVYCGCLVGVRSGMVVHHRLDRNRLDNYIKLGINHFKVSGRHEENQPFQAYLEFFVKRNLQQQFVAFYENYKVDFGRMIGALQ